MAFSPEGRNVSPFIISAMKNLDIQIVILR